MVTLAIIPARGGSKGVIRKNLRSVGGRSLVERAIAAAHGADEIDHVLLSTDDEEIAEEGRRCGAEVPFLRPQDLADDNAAISPAILHALEAFEQYADVVVDTLVLLEPTSPFRTAEHVHQAIERFRVGDCRSVISVCPLERKPENIFIRTDGQLERFVKEPRAVFTRRQEMEKLCRLNSAIYVVGRNDFIETHRLIIEPIGFIEMSGKESVNIDEELDLLLAEVVAGRYGL